MAYRTSDRSEPSVSLDRVLEPLGRRKWLALLVFAAVFGAAASVALSLPDIYRATATVLVERQQVSEVFVTPSVSAELETRIQTIEQQVMSRTRLAELISRLNLYPEARRKAPIETLVGRMRRDIRLELKGVEQRMTGRNATIAFTISYSGRDPRTVATVANALARLYVDENTKSREGQAAETAAFLKAQLEEVKQQLDAQDSRSSAFKLSHIGELPQQVEANLASLERLNTQLRLNGENQIRELDRQERLEKQLADIESAVAPTGVISARPGQLAKLRQQLHELQGHFTEAYPEVIRLRHEIATLEQRGSEDSSGNPVTAPQDPAPRLKQAIADADSELRALKTEERSLRRAITGYEQRVENVPKRQEEFQALSRDYDTTKQRYDTLLKRYEEAQLAESLEQGKKVEQFRILDSAMPPRDPAAPDHLRLLVMGFIAALGLAAAAVLAAEKFNTAFHDIDDLRAFISNRTVVRVPLILTAADTRRRRLRFAAVAVSSVAALVLIVAAFHHVASGNEQIVHLMERGNV
jgi:polysaccharide chain length determinant protein (PEP-CTERM system associated)